ncbi:MAG TPA: hypothetical protein VM008_18120, partial [Phycisphaerae bacterium]|nr:hypothetical protein [Phycisphaerae bacterium]
MCGIAGICKWERHSPAPAGALDAMLAAIRHRGPDGEGVWVSEPPKGGTPTNWVALLHSRLAVIDLPGG